MVRVIVYQDPVVRISQVAKGHPMNVRHWFLWVLLVTFLPLFNGCGYFAPDSEEGAMESWHATEHAGDAAAVAAQFGGWASWNNKLEPLRVELHSLLKEQDRSYWGLPGRDGFLFRLGSLDYVSGDVLARQIAENEDNPYDVIVNLNAQLRQRDIHLLFVPVPNKLELYPEKLISNSPENHLVELRTMWLIANLREAGVDVANLYPAFFEAKHDSEEPLFVPTDTHWSGPAIRLASDVIAEHLRPWREHTDQDPRYTIQSRTIEYRGGIAYKGGIPEALQDQYPPVQTTLQYVVNEEGRPFEAAPTAPIVIVGDSFVGKWGPGAGIVAHLAKELERPISQVYAAGGGPTVPSQLARKGSSFLQECDVVVWLMSSNYLRPSERWGSVDLP